MAKAPDASNPGPEQVPARSAPTPAIALPTPSAGLPGLISVVVPLWNEAENVLPLVRQVVAAFVEAGRDIELLLVDDASSDGTWDQMLLAQAGEPRVRPLRLLQHGGQSAALWTGFQASRGDIIATLDGDLQNDPRDLPLLLRELAGCDMVCGVRTRRMDGGLRRISTRVARRARKLVLRVDFRDSGCNLRVLRRTVLPLLLPFDGMHRFLPILAHDAGANVREIPVSHRPRTAGSSKYGVWNRLGRGLWDLALVAWYRKRRLRNLPTVEHSLAPPERTQKS